jgi:hypothetical protein
MLILEKLKILLQNYYSQKNFDIDNELNVILIKNLNEKIKEMKNEFVQIKNEKLLQKLKLDRAIEEITKTTNNKYVDKTRFENELKEKQKELELLNNDISILEMNCKKKETLFNKYIIVLRNKCKKSVQESYYDMNPSLIIETDFEEKFKEEIINNINNNIKFTIEDKTKNKNLIEIYFKELISREKILQNEMTKKKRIEDLMETLSKEIDKLEENIILIEKDIASKKKQLSDYIVREKYLREKIETRNRNLTFNLEQLGELEFEKYLKSNDNVLKNMKKVYGNKVLDKVFKVQKQKFLENVIMDHSYKKNKVNDYVILMSKINHQIEILNNSLLELEHNYKESLKKYENIIDFKNAKYNEEKIIEESRNDLKEKMEMILCSQLKELEIEKKQLQYKHNVNYYLERIRDINTRIIELKMEKENYIKEYKEFSEMIHEKEQKLYFEVK